MHIVSNIILLTMLISTIYTFLFKKKSYTLNCGIFAWVGNSPEKFNPFLFNVLGVYNDTRGGDSCGIYYNKTYKKGINKMSHYVDLVKELHLHSSINLGKIPLIIGHTRKASVGNVIMDNVQPVVLYDSKEKPCYVQAHNGTLSNYSELAKKYKIETKAGETDSAILARLIQKHGFSILSEYEGTAALVIHYPKEPKVLYAFHGKSTKWSTIPSEERPLHYVNDPEFGTYISSEKSPLEFISDGSQEVKEFKYNILYKLEGDSVIELQAIDRVKEKEKPVTTQKSITWGNNHHNHNYELEWAGRGVGKNICNIEIGRTSGATGNGVIRYTKGFFYVGNEFAHGYYNSDNWGYVSNAFNGTATDRYHLWFFCGILLISHEGFDLLNKICKEQKINVKTAMKTYDDVKHLDKTLRAYSVYPFTRDAETQTGIMAPSDLMPSDERSGSFYHGIFTPLFSDMDLYFTNGDLIGKSKKTGNGMYTITELLSDYTDLYLYGFGELDEKDKPNQLSLIDKNLEFINCTSEYPTDCDKYGNFDGSCTTCSYNKNFKEEDEEKVYLIHTIASQLIPIIKDLEKVIGEVEESGYQESVKSELNSIIASKNNLKTILS